MYISFTCYKRQGIECFSFLVATYLSYAT